MNRKIFGQRVRDARNAAHLTSDKLSELCKCTPVSIRQIESGSRLPSVPKLVDLCNVLKMDPSYFLAADLHFDVAQASSQDCDHKLDALVSNIRRLSPTQIDTICSTIETLMKHI